MASNPLCHVQNQPLGHIPTERKIIIFKTQILTSKSREWLIYSGFRTLTFLPLLSIPRTPHVRELGISADTIFYPETQYADNKAEQLIRLLYLCDERELNVATATIKAFFDNK